MIVPISTILMLLSPDEAAMALGRFDALMKNAPAIRTSLTVQASDASSRFQVDYSVSRTQRHKLTAVSPYLNFSMSMTERGRLDMDLSEKLYDQYDYIFPAKVYPSRITDQLKMFFPAFLNARSSREWFPATAIISCRREGGRDILTTKTKDADVDLVLLPNGQPVSLHRLDRVPMVGNVSFDYTFKSWRTIPDKLSLFTLAIPNGFTPITVPDPGQVTQIGQKVSVGTWTDGKQSVDVDAMAESTGVLLVFSDPTSQFQPLVDRALSRLAKTKVPILRLADAQTVPSGWYRDPSGKFLKNVNPPASPFFVLIGRDHSISFQWQGIGSDLIDALVKETNEAVKASSAGKK